MTTSLESQESDLDSTFHEPNPGFKALLSKWKVQDTDSAATASPCRSHIATIAQRKSRTVAKQEYEERRKEEIEHRKSSGMAAGETTASKKAAARMQLKNVYQHSLGVEAFTPKVFKKDVLDKELVLAALEKNFVFSDLSRTALAPLVDAFEQCSFSKGEVIIRQGDPGDYFYIIKSGRVNFLVNERPVGKAKKGASFGELSLLYTVSYISSNLDLAYPVRYSYPPFSCITLTVPTSGHRYCGRSHDAVSSRPDHISIHSTVSNTAMGAR